MTISYSPPTPIEYFANLVQTDTHFPLFEAAVAIAQDAYPLMDVESVLESVDAWLAQLRGRLAADAPPMQKLRVLNQFFFTELHFGANLNDYYDPDNSFIHKLIHTRRGIPVSLALLWMELAQGLGLEASGVGFPGHFLVKIELPAGMAVLDPLTGHSLSRDELQQKLAPYQHVKEGVADDAVPLGLYLQAATPREIIARMLRNLREIYKSERAWLRLLGVQDRLLVLLPHSWEDYRERGLAHAELGHTELALADLEQYMCNAGATHDRERVALRASDLRTNR